MTTGLLEHGPDVRDDSSIRPPLTTAVPTGHRATQLALGAVAGGTLGWLVAPSAPTALGIAAVGAAALTAVAANWSTCGLSVAGVVAAPKQPGRKGASTPLRRLGLHALGSVTTGSVTGAGLGALGALAVGGVGAGVMLAVWALVAVAYGLHELGFVTLPTPMRRRQLPRHWRRTMAPRKVSFLFGAIIGPGFLIFIRSSAYYLLVLATLAVGSPVLGAALFTVVSLGRCGPSLAAVVHTRRGGTMPRFLALSCRIDRHVQTATGMLLTALGTFTLTTLL
ncbi:hypothetical protein ACIRU8_29310 [Streptomyces sp. NPDC101175]|uniref:hypothetical protein n=1 Tax=Streptomyces sp. NPDC101175 TaxID=3366123 RepID=UPI0038340FB4